MTSVSTGRGAGGSGLAASIVMAAVATSWGCWWIVLRHIESKGIPPGWTVACLYGSAAILLAPIFALRHRHWRPALTAMLIVGLSYGISMGLWSHAVIHGNVIRVTLLFYLTPIWGTLLAVFLFEERLTMLRALAVLLGLAGAVFVLGPAQGVPLPSAIEEWMSLLAGIVFALAAAASRRWPETPDYDAIFPMFVGAAMIGIGFDSLLIGESPPNMAALSKALPLAAAAGLVLAIPAQVLLLWSAKRLDPGRISTLILFDVLATTVSARLLTDEPFGWREIFGCLCILGAGLASGIDQMRQGKRASQILGESAPEIRR